MDQIPEVQCSAEPETLMALSRLFAYPNSGPMTGTWPGFCAGRAGPCLRLSDRASKRYVSLFINRLPELPCIPCGSWYLEGTLMGPSTVKLANLYREYGFETSEIPDHICVELEFLAILSTLVQGSFDSGDTADTRLIDDLAFVIDHLAAWTPDFFDRVVSWDEEGFYGALARACQSLF